MKRPRARHSARGFAFGRSRPVTIALRGSSRPATTSTQSSKRQRNSRSTCSARPGFAAVEPLWMTAWLERSGARASHAARKRGDPIRLIGVGVSGFSEGLQGTLFDGENREEKLVLARTVDELRRQYGDKIIKRASLTKK